MRILVNLPRQFIKTPKKFSVNDMKKTLPVLIPTISTIDVYFNSLDFNRRQYYQ